MPRIYPPVRAETDMWDKLERERDQQARYRQSASPDVADRVAANNGAHWWLPAGANLSLSQGGHGPDSPVTQAASRSAATKRKREGWFDKFQDVVAKGVDVSGLDSLAKYTAGALDFTVGELGRDAASGLKDVTRPVFLAMDTGLDEVKSLIRATVANPDTPGNWFDAYRQVEASPLREVIEDVRAGRRVDIGSGILPGGEVYERKHQAAGALKDPQTGQGYTLGRTLASIVTEPGTTPYKVLSGLVDATTDLVADPSNLLLGAGAQKKLASGAFGVAERGGITSFRTTVLPERVGEWLGSREGRSLVEKIAETNDFDTLWRATGKKIPVDTTVRLADASTPEDVLDILRPALGVEVRETPSFRVRRMAKPRLLETMPGSNLPLNDADEAVEQIDRWLRNAKVDAATVAELTDRMARAVTRTEKFAVVEDATAEVAMRLTDRGLKPEAARSLTNIFGHTYEDFRRYAIDEIGENMRFPGVRVDGLDRPLPTPHLFAELLDESIPLPNARDLRRATSKFGPILDNPAIKAPQALLDFAQQDVWKRVALLRGAYTIRVIAEEQLRMAASGLDSLIRHPLSAIAIAAGKKGDLDVTGNAIAEADDLAAALNKGWAGWVDDSRVLTRHKSRVAKADPNIEDADKLRGWAGELVTLHSDPIASRVADAAVSLDDVKDHFWAGNLTWVRNEMLEKVPQLADRRVADEYIDSIAERLRIKTNGDPDLLDAVASGRLGDVALRNGDKTLNRQFQAALGDHWDQMPDYVVVDVMGRAKGATGSDLFQHFDNATGLMFSFLMTKPTNYLSRSVAFKQKYWQRAEELYGFMDDAARASTLDAARRAKMKDVVKRLERFGADASLDPDSVVVLKHLEPDAVGTVLGHGALLDLKDAASRMPSSDEFVYHVSPRSNLEGIVENGLRPGKVRPNEPTGVYFASSGVDASALLPTRNVREAVALRVRRSATKLINGKALDTEFVARDTVAPELIEVLTSDGWKPLKRSGITLEQADMVAKGWALDETKKLLYDMSERSQFFDIARYIFPFGEAWKEVLTRWAKIGWERPQTIRRGQQIVTGARGSGFFHEDPATGEEVFVYPGSQWLTKNLIGVPIPLTGRVAGLSLATEVLPGVGPAVQVPAGWLIPDRPEWDAARALLFPFGEADTSGGFLEGYLPPWMQKWKRAYADPEQDRLFANTVMDVQRYLVANGDYDTSTPEGVRELMEDAKERAKDLYLIRAASQFVAPSAPTPRMLAMDPEGRLVAAQKILDDYRQMQEEDYDTATDRFLAKYGEDALLYTQSKSNTLTYNAPVTKEGLTWARSNPEVVERFPNTYGFFAPQGGEFDYNAYARQFESGERETITPQQAIRLANNRVAQTIYENAKSQVGESPSDEQAAWLRQVRAALIDDYPGFQDFTGLAQKADTPTLIRELADAVEDDTLKGTPIGGAVGLYLQAREKAQAAAEEAGLASFATAKSMRGTRDWLRQVADSLVTETPDFAPAWDLVFSRELADDETEPVGG